MKVAQRSGMARLGAAALHIGDALADNGRAAFAIFSLGALLAYLIAAEVIRPGSTPYWGYLTGQMGAVLIALVLGEILFARQGGLSWVTHVVAAGSCYADTLGTAAHYYLYIQEYDKVTHFAGSAAFSSGAYDCLRGLHAQRRISAQQTTRLWLCIALGVGVGFGWEVYEFIGDKVFHTARVYGFWDTFNDIVSDALGAVTGLLLAVFEQRAAERELGTAIAVRDQREDAT